MTYKKKLIEVALPLEDINREAAREKSIRHGHPSTLHLWWARRPLAACRAVLFASLVDDPSECVDELLRDDGKRKAAEKLLKGQKKLWIERKATYEKATAAGMANVPEPGPEPKLEDFLVEQERERLFDIIRKLVKWENSNNDRVLNAARAEIMRSCNGNPPPVYDPFCGGGSIPLEAQRLGLETHASDLNPVPVLITKALIELPAKFAGKAPINPESKEKFGNSTGSWKGAAGLAEDIRYYGEWMRNEAVKRIGHFYPKVKLPQENGAGEATVIAWLWARTVVSPNPAAKGVHVPLVRSFWLSTKSGNKAYVEPVIDQQSQSYRFEVRTGGGEPRAGTVSKKGGICLMTNTPIPFDYIRSEGKLGRLGCRLMAIVAEGPSGRIYVSPNDKHESIATKTEPTGVPDTDLPKQALGFRVQNYGLSKHRHLFTNRQLTALTTFSDLVRETHEHLCRDFGHKPYADAVATYLGFLVGRGADYWSANCSWHNSKELIRNTFARQALPIVWDFAETNPLSDSAGNFAGALQWVAKVLEALPPSSSGFTTQLSATELDKKGCFMFSTDPPYYDNVPYADLSDFFYVWLRRSLQCIYPELLSTVLVPKAEELIAEPFRQGSKEAARLFFESGMVKVFTRMKEASNTWFPTTIYYAFKQAEAEDEDGQQDKDSESRASTGWETFLEGLINAGWQINGTWPIRTELGNRMRNLASNALASSIVLVCRVRPDHSTIASRREFLGVLKKELPTSLRDLQRGNIAPVDLAQSAIGPGMAVYSRFDKVLEPDGSSMSVRTALALINQTLDEVLAEQEGEFDTDTRWALSWFEQNGFNDAAYGIAETLSKAKNTSVTGMAEAGILQAKGGKVRLLKKEELPADWDPQSDKRLTIWEATHQLVRRLEQGEQAASELMVKLGPIAEIARDLSYRLYTICERKKWAQEAIGYNSLVLAWPDLTRLAQDNKTISTSQGELGV